MESGFLTTNLYCIQEDSHNNLWISTDYGLSRFNMSRQRAITYTVENGISDNEFNRASSFKDSRGILYFGGMNGVTSFDPGVFARQEEEQLCPFLLTKVSGLDESLGHFKDLTESVRMQGGVVLDEQLKWLTIRFAMLDYEDRLHRYAYQVMGLDKDWHYVLSDVIQIGNLPYGNYTLRIRAQREDGEWNAREILLGITMQIPFYKTGWFLILAGLTAVSGVLLIIQVRTRVLHRQKVKLAEIVEAQTQQLRSSLSEQQAMLQEIHHRVKNNLQFIEAIIGMQINRSTSEISELALSDINRRIHAMTLLHDMLYAKDGMERIAFSEYLEELLDKLTGMTESQMVKVQLDTKIVPIALDMNSCLALGMITSELISNSLKHAFASIDAPRITIRLTYEKSAERVTYIIQDNGVGINTTVKSEGLGLRLVDIFVRQLRGTYKITGDEGFSFVLLFNLPPVNEAIHEPNHYPIPAYNENDSDSRR